jgi:hypothetical protein
VVKSFNTAATRPTESRKGYETADLHRIHSQELHIFLPLDDFPASIDPYLFHDVG